MKFITNIDEKKYENFLKKSSKDHFLQSYLWGQFARKSKGLIPHYVGMIDEKDNLVCTALLLQKKLPLGYSYFYSPRGFVIDFNNTNILTEFTTHLKKYVKENKGIFLKIDPDIKRHNLDIEGNILEGENNYDLIRTLEKIRYTHKGYFKNFELEQPRFTFRINLDKPFEEIYNNFSKTTIQRIKKAEEMDVEVKIGDIYDVETFSDLSNMTENRKNFISHDSNYYKTLYEIYNNNNNSKCVLFLASVNPKKIYHKFKNKLKELTNELEKISAELKTKESKSLKSKFNELEKQVQGVEKQSETFKEYSEKYTDDIVISSYFIIYHNDSAWVLFAGNHNELTETFANYKIYLEHVHYAKENNIKMYDLFGTTGDLSKDNSRLGLHEFKKKFGGEYTEFIGEFDLITNKPMYFLFTKLIPLYRKIKKKALKRKKDN